MFGTTMLLTVGHALDRAKDEGMVVRVNIAGDWVTGRIINSDGHGVADPREQRRPVRRPPVTVEEAGPNAAE